MNASHRSTGHASVATTWVASFLFCVLSSASAGLAASDASASGERIAPIDLPTALRLAGAQNLDVQIARERLTEAQALQRSTLLQFFPWVNVGVAYDKHKGQIQATEGDILSVDKQSYAVGATITGQWELGEALYRSLAAKQVEIAAGHALEVQRQQSVLEAVRNYFDLARAQAEIDVARESVRIADDYETQLRAAVDAGMAFRGDLLRASVQAQRNRLAQQRSTEGQRTAASRLAHTLRLDATVDLVAREQDLTPLVLIDARESASALVQQALLVRTELKESEALLEAAHQETNNARYGPLVPSLRAQVFGGGLGGGRDGDTGDFSDREDYSVGLGWRIGPGGIFDFPRQRAAMARSESARLRLDNVRNEIARQVVDAVARVHSQAEQIDGARLALTAAEEALSLTRQRKEFGVGIVLENIQAEQDLTRARTDYLAAVAEHNKAQYELARAIGSLPAAP